MQSKKDKGYDASVYSSDKDGRRKGKLIVQKHKYKKILWAWQHCKNTASKYIVRLSAEVRVTSDIID